jgi:hypothetical protein
MRIVEHILRRTHLSIYCGNIFNNMDLFDIMDAEDSPEPASSFAFDIGRSLNLLLDPYGN